MKNIMNLMQREANLSGGILLQSLGKKLKIASLSLLLTLLAFALGGISTSFAHSAEGLPRVT